MVLMALLLACGPKVAPKAAATPIPVDVALVESPLGTAAPSDVPDGFRAAIEEALGERNLVPRDVPATEWTEPFTAKRVADQRASWLVERAGHGDAVLLLDLQPRYFGFVSGRYRWTVTVDLVLRDATRADHEITDHFEVPALLTWDHEREDAAIEAASLVIRERVEDRVEDWLGG